MVNFIVWLVVGGLVGYVASRIMGTNGQQGVVLDVVVGIVGAFLAGLVLSPLFGIGNINDGNFSIPSLLLSLVGAIILLAIVKFVRRAK